MSSCAMDYSGMPYNLISCNLSLYVQDILWQLGTFVDRESACTCMSNEGGRVCVCVCVCVCVLSVSQVSRDTSSDIHVCGHTHFLW